MSVLGQNIDRDTARIILWIARNQLTGLYFAKKPLILPHLFTLTYLDAFSTLS